MNAERVLRSVVFILTLLVGSLASPGRVAASGPLENSLKLREIRFDEDDSHLKGEAQFISDPMTRSDGAISFRFSEAIEPGNPAAVIEVEQMIADRWQRLPRQELIVGLEEPTKLKVLARNGWHRGSRYRLRLAGIRDHQLRSTAMPEVIEWPIARPGQSSNFVRKMEIRYDSATAAADTLGGRFPGGQSLLFQGAWTDPITGLALHRARWYDARNATWLSEDPLQDIDSPNLYAFVGLAPHAGVDPLGHCFTDALMQTGLCQAVNRNLLYVDEGALEADGEVKYLLAKFQREHGRPPQPNETVLDDPQNRRYLVGSGRWLTTTGEIRPAYDELLLVGVGYGASKAFLTTRGAGGTFRQGVISAVISAGDDLAGELIGLNPSLAKGLSLNLGSGSNPMPGAVNLDKKLNSTVDVMSPADRLPFADGTFEAVHAVNPYGFQPVSRETARVLKPGALLMVSGAPSNKWAKKVNDAVARDAGFEIVEEVPLHPTHRFGEPARTNGVPIEDVDGLLTVTYRRLP